MTDQGQTSNCFDNPITTAVRARRPSVEQDCPCLRRGQRRSQSLGFVRCTKNKCPMHSSNHVHPNKSICRALLLTMTSGKNLVRRHSTKYSTPVHRSRPVSDARHLLTVSDMMSHLSEEYSQHSRRTLCTSLTACRKQWLKKTSRGFRS